MKTLVFGDIHGRTQYTDIIEKENPDKVIFLGDYVSTHEGISSEQQINVVIDLLARKKAESERYILLRGNHDIQHLGYSWAECSGYDRKVGQWMYEHRDEFLVATQWIYVYKNIIFSHAGISEVWMHNCGIDNLDTINTMQPSELFGFNPDSFWDTTGNSVTQPPVWIRPDALVKCYYKGYDHIVGHTPVKEIINLKEYLKDKIENNIWLCDMMPMQYIVIKNGKITVVDYGV